MVDGWQSSLARQISTKPPKLSKLARFVSHETELPKPALKLSQLFLNLLHLTDICHSKMG